MNRSAHSTHIREMTLADCQAVAAVRVLGWQTSYVGLVPQPYLDAMSIEEATEQCRTHLTAARPGVTHLVAEHAGEVVGWACRGPYREAEGVRGTDPAHAELYTLYVHPDRLSTGTGRALMAESMTGARGAGFTSMSLWVLRDNSRARRFYEKAGFSTDNAPEPFELGGATLHDVRYTRPL
ncbi:GNAT family N-acetyltransferase [Streptomyces sp. NPDC048442]|uniref:GNAT family N-acetyltransferase n=1 Tax=Streptomyces sp. NPDC048442 TaxID=3154823 RepID=UPI00342778A4